MGYGIHDDEPETGAGSDAPAAVNPVSTDAGHVVSTATSGTVSKPLVEYLLRLGDDRLVLGHRLSEWAGHAPILEEDIALSNIALDLIGQANLLLDLAGTTEGSGRTADALAYFRDAVDFRNVQLVELPIGDFGFTIVRQFLFSAFQVPFLARLQQSSDETVAGIAAKGYKEAVYHLRHSADWMLKLGDGTAESHDRAQAALDALWPYVHELLHGDAVDDGLVAQGVAVDLTAIAPLWRKTVTEIVAAATLTLPADGWHARGGRAGKHTEHLGHMLAEMQILARSHPGAQW